MALKLTTRSSWMDFRDALEAGQDFTTSGALSAKATPNGAVRGGYTLGHLPREFHASVADADFIVYSYATPIAWRTQGQWHIPNVKYSATTSRHQSRIFTAISQL